MPTKLKRVVMLATDAESEAVKRRADSKGLSVSNYQRDREGFKVLHHGAAARKKAKVKV